MEQYLSVMNKAGEIKIKQESDEKLKRALRNRIREHKFEDAINIGEKVYYKRENESKWRGPAKIIRIDGKSVIVKHGSTLREIARIHITKIQKYNENEKEEYGETDNAYERNVNKKIQNQFLKTKNI